MHCCAPSSKVEACGFWSQAVLSASPTVVQLLPSALTSTRDFSVGYTPLVVSYTPIDSVPPTNVANRRTNCPSYPSAKNWVSGAPKALFGSVRNGSVIGEAFFRVPWLTLTTESP